MLAGVVSSAGATGAATIAGHASGNGVPLSSQWVDITSADGVTYTDSTPTTADGSYVFTGVPAGTYRVCVDSHTYGLVPQCFDHVDRNSPSPDEPGYTPLVVADGAQITGINFDLVEGGGLEGTITDARTGQAIANLDAFFGYYDAQGSYYGEGHLHTDADGRYRVVGMPDGDYYVSFNAYGPFSDAAQVYGGPCDTQCDPIQGTLITIVNGSIHPGIDFQLNPVAIIRGHVRDAVTHAAVGGALVSSFYSKLSPWGTLWDHAWSTRSNVNGEYELYAYTEGRVAAQGGGALVDIVYPDIPCSSNFISDCVYGAQTVIVPVPQPLDIDFSLPTGVGISGTVLTTPASAPLARAVVTIVSADETVRVEATTEADGSFRVPASMPRASDVYYARVQEEAWPHTCAVYLDRPCPAAGNPFSSVNPTPIHLSMGMNQLQISLTEDGIFHAAFDP